MRPVVRFVACVALASGFARCHASRIVASVLLVLTVLLSGGCAILEMERTNRGGYLDYVVDRNWMKADSKGMRALRAFAIQVSLARIASVSAKNESDRQLLAIRIGALTKRFLPIYACAFDTNPLGVPGAQSDPCFYYDSAMVDYSSGLFDLAMVALPTEDAKRLINSVTGGALTGGVANPLNIADLLETILAIARDAIKYGRIIGGLYRDTVELEVQVWLGTPAIDNRPPAYRVTDIDIAGLAEVYAGRNDDMRAWLAEIAALRARGLEPLPQGKFFAELGGLMRYLCDLITKDTAANSIDTCKAGLPKTLPPPLPVIGDLGSTRVGGPIIGRPGTGGGSGSSHRPGGSDQKPTRPSKTALRDIDDKLDTSDKVIAALVQTISSPGPNVDATTVDQAAGQIVLQTQQIDELIKRARALNEASAKQYQSIAAKLKQHRDVIGMLRMILKGPAETVTAVTVKDAAEQIVFQAKGIRSLIKNLLDLDKAATTAQGALTTSSS